ncbi:MAG: Mov34/MPN/PAD-1 family protein [Enhydrobacter sp.]|nr:MAG: Mov34/MPN/PAD-1 family protein [Enhydrobacter sp.]
MSMGTDTLRPLEIETDALCQIAATVGGRRAEFGGMLGAGDDGVVRHFAFDRGARRDGKTYAPDTRALSRLYREDWKPRGIRIVGFVHSHPPGTRQPSWADAEYAARLLDWQPDLDRLLMPIVMAEPDTGRFEFLPYVALRNGATARIAPVGLRCTEACAAPAEAVATSGTPVRPRWRWRTAAALAAVAFVATAALLMADHGAPVPADPAFEAPAAPQEAGPP